MREETMATKTNIEEDPIIEESSPTVVKKSVVDAAANEIKNKRALPPKPGDKVSFAELCKWLRLLDTPEKRERIQLYVYRIHPVIDRQRVDPDAKKNIDIISDGYDVLSEDYFIDTHGGGKYSILVFDSDNKDLQRNGFFQARLELSQSVYGPPKLDLNEVVWDDNKNKGFKQWAQAQKLIGNDCMPIIEKKNETTTTTQDAVALPMVKLFMDFVDRQSKENQEKIKVSLAGNDSSKGIQEIMLEKMKQDDPTKLVTIITTLMTAMKGNDKPAPDPMQTMMPIITMIQSSNDRMNQILMEMIKSKNVEKETQRDPFDQFEKMLELAHKIKGGGTVASEPSSTFDKILEVGGQILPGVLTTLNNIWAMNAASKGMNGVIQPVPQSTQQPDISMQQPQQQQVSVQQALPQPLSLSQKQEMIRSYGPLFIQNLTKEGWAFAEWISNGMPEGEQLVAIMCKDGAQDLINTVKSVPEVWSKIENIYGEPHFVKWVEEFVNHKAIIQQLENEELETA